MAKEVDFKGLAVLEFPDDWSDQAILDELKSKDAEVTRWVTQSLKESAVAGTDSEPDSQASGFQENLGGAVGSAAEGASMMVSGAARQVGVAAELAPPTPPRGTLFGGSAVGPPLSAPERQEQARKEETFERQRPTTPEDLVRRIEENPATRFAERLEQGTHERFPTLHGQREGFWTGAVPQGVGTAVGAVGAGLVGGPVAAGMAMFGAEANDAYTEEMARQAAAGETPDPYKAFRKSALYGTWAAAVETKLGAGHIAKRLKQAFGAGVKPTKGALLPFIAGVAKEAGLGFTEEGLQRAGQDVIVHGDVDLDAIAEEGAAGAVVQGLFHVPVSVAEARKRRRLAPLSGETADRMEGQAGAGQEPRTETTAGAGTPDAEDELASRVADLTGGEVVDLTEEEITGADEAVAAANAPTDMPAMSPGGTHGDPIPEAPAAIAEQLRLTADPESTKAATLLTPGENPPETGPDGLEAVDTPHGIVVYNPAKVTEQQVLEAASGKLFDGRILGMAATGADVSSPIVVTTSTPAAKNVVTEVVEPNPEAIQAAIAAQQASVPRGTSEVRPAIEVAQERLAAATARKPAEEMSPSELLDDALGRIPPEMRADIPKLGLKRDVEFPADMEGSGGILRGNNIFLEAGESVDRETVLHEVLHAYVNNHPELVDPDNPFGFEKAVDALHSDILARERAANQPAQGDPNADQTTEAQGMAPEPGLGGVGTVPERLSEQPVQGDPSETATAQPLGSTLPPPGDQQPGRETRGPDAVRDDSAIPEGGTSEEETYEEKAQTEPEALKSDIWTASDEELENLLGGQPTSSPGAASPTVTYTFRDQAEFNGWMDARFAEHDMEGMSLGFKDAPTAMKVGYIKATKALATPNPTLRAVISNIATASPLPPGWNPVPRTTPRPQPGSMPPVPPAGAPAPPRPPSRPGAPPPPPRTPTPLHRFNITALVQLLRLFGKQPRINRLLKKAYGRYIRADQSVELKSRMLWDKKLAQRVLAHEIGHFVDEAITRFGKGKQFAYRWQPLLNFRTQIWKVAQLKDAARSLSRQWRGPFRNGDRYRDSPQELFADAMSAILNDPQWVNQNHPLIHDTFQGLLDGKPDFRAAYRSLEDWLRTGAIPGKIAEQLESAFDASRQKLAEGEAAQRGTLTGTLKGMLVTPWHRDFDIEGRPTDLGTRGIDALEHGDTYAARHIALMRDDFLRKVQPLLNTIRGGGEIARDVFGQYLVANRVINERRASGAWIEAHPTEAAQVLEEVFKAQPALGAKWRGRLAALGPNPTGTQIYDFAAAVFREVHDMGEKVVTQVERAISKSKLGIEGAPALAAFNVRGMLLNPSGLTPETAQELIAHIDATLNPTEQTNLREAAKQFFDIAHPVMEDAHTMGLISDRVYNEIVVPNRYNYVPFAVADYWDGKVGAGIKNQFGTARDIIDPVVALQQRLASMLHWQQRQGQVITLMGSYARSGSPLSATRELDNVNEILTERSENKNDDKSRLVLWRNGRPWLVEFPNDPGKTFERAMERRLAHEEFARLYYLTGWSNWNHLVLSFFTVLNPAFVSFRNPIRDTRTTAQAQGFGRTAQQVVAFTDRWRLARNYAKAAYGGELEPEVRAMVEDGSLPPPRIASMLASDPVALYDMILNGTILAGEIQMGRSPKPPGAVAKTTERVMRPWLKFAVALEAMPKIMAREAALKGGHRPELAAWFAKHAGIPNPGVGGTYSGFLEAFFPWTRVHTQGMRRTLDIARDPKLNRMFAARFALTEAAPRVAKWLLASGAIAAALGLDDDDDSWLAAVGEFFRRVSPYKMAIDNVIPLGFRDPRTGEYHSLFSVIGTKKKDIPKHWEAVSIRIPSSEEGKLWGALTYEVLAGITPEKTGRKGQGVLGNVWDWGKTQAVTGFSPPLKLVHDVAAMMIGGTNPKDDFRGTPIANEELFKAGWGEGRGQAIMGAAMKQLGFPGEVLSGVALALGMDPRAIDPSRKSADPVATMAKVPVIKSMMAFDNYAPFRDDAMERAEEDAVRARSRLLMSDDVRKLYDFYGRNVRDQEKLDAVGKRRFEVAKSWHSNVWGDKRSPWKAYPHAKAAVGKDGTPEARATVKEDLERRSQGYVSRFKSVR